MFPALDYRLAVPCSFAVLCLFVCISVLIEVLMFVCWLVVSGRSVWLSLSLSLWLVVIHVRAVAVAALVFVSETVPSHETKTE